MTVYVVYSFEYIAIMCEDDDGEKFWFHHYKLVFEARGAKFE